MRISVIIPSFYPAVVYGGTIFASLNYARMLAKEGHQIFVSTTNTNRAERLKVTTGEFMEIENNIFVKYYNETIVDKFSFSFYLNISKDIKKAEVVHIQAIFNTPIPISLIYSRLFKKPVLLSPHGVLGEWVMNEGSAFKKIWLRFFIKPFAGYVNWHATSEQEKNEILHHFPEAKIYTVPNPIILDEYENINVLSKSAFLNKFTNRSGNPERILVSMGRLQKKKGFDILIKSFLKVKDAYPSACLLIAGHDEGEKQNLEKLIRDRQLENNIFFTGHLEGQDKVDFLGNADLFVLPSHNENFGIVYAEALAAGTPVIASTETPWSEVETFKCGKWVKNTIKEMAAAMLDMLRADRDEKRKNAIEFVKRFSINNVTKALDNVFKVIVNRNA